MTNEITIKEGSALDQLRANYPQDLSDQYVKRTFPQIRFKAKAVLDEDGEKVLHKAGTFMLVTRSEEQNADGKYTYEETPIGDSITIDALYERYRLSYYDGAAGSYVSSPVFDDKNEVVKLFKDGKEYASGTVAELQALPEFTVEEDGKKKCKLQLQKVLYVLYNDEVHETVLSVGNGFAWRKYKKDTMAQLVHTTITSKKTEYGGNKYNEMVFTEGEYLTEEEAERNLAIVKDIKAGIEAEKAYYNQPTQAPAMVQVTGVDALPEGEDF